MTRLAASFFGAALIALAATLRPIPAHASLSAPQDAARCTGEYVVGLTGRTGLWLDAVGPLCAGWDGRAFQPTPGRRSLGVGGKGGAPRQQTCPAGSAIAGWEVESVLQGDADFTDKLTVHCQTLAPPHNDTGFFLMAGQNNLRRAAGGPRAGKCPANQLATSVSVWTSLDGAFVKNVDMRCAAAPHTFSSMVQQGGAGGTVNFLSPEIKVRSNDVVRLDWCHDWATNCGAPAAQALCASKGMARAVSFAAKPNVGLTVVIAGQRICNNTAGCTGFANIVCGPAQ